MSLLTAQAHTLSPAAQATEAAYARYFIAQRESLYLWRTHAAQAIQDAMQAEKETAHAEWRRLVGEVGGGL